MEQVMEHKRNTMWYALPIAGAAVFMLARRFRGREEVTESTDQLLLDESEFDLQSAMSIALRHIPGTPVEVELEDKNGMAVWEVEIVPKKGGPTREVVIDAKTGDILEVKSDYNEC